MLYFSQLLGYGLGSSGTVVVAVYDRYAKNCISDVPELKKLFAGMEAFYHGSSSGIDPLQCYFGRHFQISTDGIMFLADDFLPEGFHIGLLDTGLRSDTGPLVNGFRKQREDPGFLRDFEERYLPCVGNCVDSLIRDNHMGLFAALKELQQAQLRFFRKMIPDGMLPFFKKHMI